MWNNCFFITQSLANIYYYLTFFKLLLNQQVFVNGTSHRKVEWQVIYPKAAYSAPSQTFQIKWLDWGRGGVVGSGDVIGLAYHQKAEGPGFESR